MIFDVKMPILGFEDTTKVELEKMYDCFARLKSVDGKGFTFTMLNPYTICKQYEFDMPLSYKALLEVTANSNIEIYNILILNKSVEESTINMLAPVILNYDNKTMAQIILDPNQYPFYHPTEKIKNFLQQNMEELK
ncbi:flagellar assembly protein FliW [Campylobacter sp. Cr9]|uniref:flagellar assembly protein FliW n=1 Tax=unclassified Campylobacter TaxID=2593542 RepID=UPI001EFC24B4|nr:flagellar assembly protein FliW [Campylobacter sp. RM5004]MBZ7984900.1 flagellar assembly protein FliW [Campylobacter sp. Cr9]ULO02226.1 putative flagellin level sensor protein FliW [Campylobacter sp. RM5004]